MDQILTVPVLLGVIVVGLAVLVGKRLYKKDTAIEERRKHAIKVAGLYGAAGLVHVEKVLTCYAVGDYSGIAKELHAAYVLLDQPGAAEKFLSDLKARLNTASPPTAPDAPAAK